MIKKNQRVFSVLFWICDCSCSLISLIMAYYIRFYRIDSIVTHQDHLLLIDYIPIMLGLLVFNSLFYFFYKLYAGKRSRSFVQEFKDIFVANVLSISSLISALYIVKTVDYSRLVIFIYFFVNLMTATVFRLSLRVVLKLMRKKGYNIKYLLLIGTGKTARMVIQRINENPQFGYKVCGCLSDEIKTGGCFCSVKVLGKIDELDAILAEKSSDEVMVALDLEQYEVMGRLIVGCEKRGVKVRVVPAYYSYMSTKPELEDLDGIPLLTLRKIPLANVFNAFIKRTMDICGSLILLILASPIMLFSAMVIKLTKHESVFFKQTRIGLDCTPFTMYKFRSMVSTNESERWTKKNDSRRTPFGTFIRRFSIDELPQLLNVLKGDMSLVGPRPEQEQYAMVFMESVPHYMVKHQVKPGITGLAQIKGLRGDTSINERIKTDLYYIENWNLLLDITILIKTALGAFYNKNE